MSLKLQLKNFILLFFVSFSFVAYPQTNDLLLKPWQAEWISVPNEPLHDYGVYQFRKAFTLSSKPASFIVHVSADNRYKLFVNGKFVSLGPARGDIFHWNFETIDIAPYLQNGKNAIAAVVWNYGDMRPEAQISSQTGFILQGNSEAEKIVNTDKTWKCRRDSSYSAKEPKLIYTYYVAGPGETINFNLSLKNWKNADFDDNAGSLQIKLLKVCQRAFLVMVWVGCLYQDQFLRWN
jgi:hypothetical protein